MRNWIGLAFALVVVDQLTKFAAVRWLVLHTPEPLLPSFNLTLVYNSGAAFSLLSDAGGWQRWFFIAAAVAVSALLWSWLARLGPGEKTAAAGLSLILGGAVGNALDRLFRGHVVDFLDLYYRHYHWPAFNVADACITLGALVIVCVAVAGKETEDGSTTG